MPQTEPSNSKVLEVKGLRTEFLTNNGSLPAVDRVSFDLVEGETLGIVGESGCGKSVTALSILRLIPEPPGKIAEGKILYRGKDLMQLSDSDMRSVRGNKISMVFQEPVSSLNPVFTIGNQISEAIRLHQGLGRKEAWAKAIEMLKLVKIADPGRRAGEYPMSLSGGMCQRAMIAMALSSNPDILIADEPTTALDVTIQAQILDLIESLKDKIGMSVIFITHDLGIIAEKADRVVVMYAGVVVEQTSIDELFANPLHPYTVGLMESIPDPKEKKERLKAIPGVVPDISSIPQGCRFRDRCRDAFEPCGGEEPELVDCPDSKHLVRCYKYIEPWISRQS